MGNRIWAYGIRNSFGFAFDPETDVLWETENGPACNDEVNKIRRGGNFGGDRRRPATGHRPATRTGRARPVSRPKLVYETTIGITGIAFCDGCGLAAGATVRPSSAP